jgi:YesN/AraC family two-component response regulator
MVKRFGYSPIYISRLFKKYVGVTLSDYLKEIRLSHTAYYLENTNYSLQQICNLVGLDNLSYLNKIFKEKYGTTPIKYRKMAIKKLLIRIKILDIFFIHR